MFQEVTKIKLHKLTDFETLIRLNPITQKGLIMWIYHIVLDVDTRHPPKWLLETCCSKNIMEYQWKSICHISCKAVKVTNARLTPLNWFPIGTLFKLGYITPIQLTGTSIRINVDKLAHTSSAGGVVLKLSNFGEQLQLKSHKSLDIKNTDCRTYYWMNGMTKILTRSWPWYTDGKAAKCLVEGSGCPK